PPTIYPLSLHDALPISRQARRDGRHLPPLPDRLRVRRRPRLRTRDDGEVHELRPPVPCLPTAFFAERSADVGVPRAVADRTSGGDRKSTRLNSSHVAIS